MHEQKLSATCRTKNSLKNKKLQFLIEVTLYGRAQFLRDEPCVQKTEEKRKI
jgi:hypothetical protein